MTRIQPALAPGVTTPAPRRALARALAGRWRGVGGTKMTHGPRLGAAYEIAAMRRRCGRHHRFIKGRIVPDEDRLGIPPRAVCIQWMVVREYAKYPSMIYMCFNY